jgi:hypothetical protein
MIAQADGVARFLQCDVLLAPENIQRADRCIEIFVAKQEGPYCPVNAVEIERLVKPPASLDEGKQRVNAAPNDYNIERITVGITGLVGNSATVPASRVVS